MTRVLLWAVTLLLVITMCGCGGSSSNKTATDETPTDDSPTTVSMTEKTIAASPAIQSDVDATIAGGAQ